MEPAGKILLVFNKLKYITMLVSVFSLIIFLSFCVCTVTSRVPYSKQSSIPPVSDDEICQHSLNKFLFSGKVCISSEVDKLKKTSRQSEYARSEIATIKPDMERKMQMEYFHRSYGNRMPLNPNTLYPLNSKGPFFKGIFKNMDKDVKRRAYYTDSFDRIVQNSFLNNVSSSRFGLKGLSKKGAFPSVYQKTDQTPILHLTGKNFSDVQESYNVLADAFEGRELRNLRSFNKRTKRQTSNGPVSQSVLRSIPFRCEGICGNPQYMPCSCSANCIVYKNCCEGFDEDCPEIVEAGQEKYADFLDADVTCIRSDVLVVTSCRQSPLDGNDTDYRPTTSPTTLSEFLNSIGPIYDTYTDLIFRNQTIFQCNKYPQSDGFLWGIAEIKISDPILSNQVSGGNFTVEGFSTSLLQDPSQCTFIPYPDGRYGKTTCVHKVKRTCSFGFDDDSTFMTYKEKCESLISYVTCSATVYTNYYCMKCSNLFNEAVVCENIFHNPDARSSGNTGLSLLVSFSSDEKMVVEVESAKPLQKSWQSFSCDIDKWNTCNVKGCATNFILSANNTCNRLFTSVVHIHIKFKMHLAFLNALTDFVDCELAKNDLSHSVKSSQKYETDGGFGTIFLKIPFHAYALPNAIVTFEEINFDGTLEEMLKVYFAYHDAIAEEDTFAQGEITVCACLSTASSCSPHCKRDFVFKIYNASAALVRAGDDSSSKCITVLDNVISGSEIGYSVVNILSLAAAIVTSMRLP